MSRKFMDDLDGLVESVLETGKEQVTKYEFKQVVQEESEDGFKSTFYNADIRGKDDTAVSLNINCIL